MYDCSRRLLAVVFAEGSKLLPQYDEEKKRVAQVTLTGTEAASNAAAAPRRHFFKPAAVGIAVTMLVNADSRQTDRTHRHTQTDT